MFPCLTSGKAAHLATDLFGPRHPQGTHARLGEGSAVAQAPVGPSLIRKVSNREYRLLSLGDDVVLEPAV